MNYKRKNILLLLILFGLFSLKTQAQNSGVNSKPANGSSILDLSNNPNKALLLPRVNLLSTGDVVTIPSPAPYTMAYATTSNDTGPTAIIANNLYIFDGTTWKRLTVKATIDSYDLPKVVAAGFNADSISVISPTNVGANVKTAMNLTTIVGPANTLASNGAFTAPKDGFYAYSVGFAFFGTGNPTQAFYDTPYIIARDPLGIAPDLTGFSFRLRGSASGNGQPTKLGITGSIYLTAGTKTSGFYWSKGNNTNIIKAIKTQSVIWEYLGNPTAIP